MLIGASAIGRLPQGYVQHARGASDYLAALREGRFAIARGVALTADDRLRRAVIEAVMCDLEVDLQALAAAHRADPGPVIDAAASLARFEADGLVRRYRGVVQVTEAGRPFVRNVSAVFDAIWTRTRRRRAMPGRSEPPGEVPRRPEPFRPNRRSPQKQAGAAVGGAVRNDR